MSRRQHWLTLWQRDPAPGETGFPELSQSYRQTNANACQYLVHIVQSKNSSKRIIKNEKDSPFLHHNTFGFCFKEELIHSVFFSIKMLLIKGLQTRAETTQTHIQNDCDLVQNDCVKNTRTGLINICLTQQTTWFLKPLSTPRVCVQKQCLIPRWHMR